MRTPDNPAELASAAPTEPPPAPAPTAGDRRTRLQEAMRRAHERKRALGLPWKGNRQDKGKGKNKRAKGAKNKPVRTFRPGGRKGGPTQSREQIEAFRAKLRPYIDTHTGAQLAKMFKRAVSTVAYHLAAMRREVAEGRSKAVAVVGHGGRRGRPPVVVVEEDAALPGGEPLQRALQLIRDANRRNYRTAWAVERELSTSELEVALAVKLALGDDPMLNP